MQVINTFKHATSHPHAVRSNKSCLKQPDTIFDYHSRIVLHLQFLQWVAQACPEKKEVCQNEFLQLSVESIQIYSLHFTALIEKLASAGLKNHSYMLLSGASSLLGGDDQGGIFRHFIDFHGYAQKQAVAPRPTFVKISEIGFYIESIRELLHGLNLFCNNHLQYKRLMSFGALSH